MANSTAARLWRTRDKLGWRNFAVAILVLSAALAIALFSAAVGQEGRLGLAALTTVIALAMAGWVAITIVPALARRSSLRWIAYQIDYKLTRDGIIYLIAVFILILAAVNTGNNLLFLILACLLAGILVSGVLSRAVLTGVSLKFDLPEHIFSEQPVLAEVELRNEKQLWPSFSLRVTGEIKKGAAEILTRPVFFPYIQAATSTRQKVELRFPHRGVYRQDAFGIRTRFPFGFFEKTRRVDSPIEIVVYPRVEPTDQLYEILPLLSGEMASYFRGRGHELHSLRDYLPTDSARFVDWKRSAKSGALVVREFAREDERRVMLVFDPFIGPLAGAASASASAVAPGATGGSLGSDSRASGAPRARDASPAAASPAAFSDAASRGDGVTTRVRAPGAPASGASAYTSGASRARDASPAAFSDAASRGDGVTTPDRAPGAPASGASAYTSGASRARNASTTAFSDATSRGDGVTTRVRAPGTPASGARDGLREAHSLLPQAVAEAARILGAAATNSVPAYADDRAPSRAPSAALASAPKFGASGSPHADSHAMGSFGGRDVRSKVAPASDAGSSDDPAAVDRSNQFERAVSMAACIAWHFHESHSVLQFRTHRFSTPMAPASDIIYPILRELALIEPDSSATGGAFLDDLASDREVFKIIITARAQRTIPTALWSSSYFLFIDRL
jgi:uncharacterized protein (DUF58 family)